MGEVAHPGSAEIQLPRTLSSQELKGSKDTFFICGIDYTMLVFLEHCASKYLTTGSLRIA